MEPRTEGELRIGLSMDRHWLRVNWYKAPRDSLIACLHRIAWLRAQLRADETTSRVPNPWAKTPGRGRRLEQWPPAVHAAALMFGWPGRDPEPEKGRRR